ncbi:MAG: ROK family glucokinase [Actinomycetes bacterium]
MTFTIGFDIGGTKLAAGVVDEAGRILQMARRDTPSADPNEIEDAIAEVVAELCEHHEVSAVGIGAAGFIDSDGAVVLFAPNLAWRNEPLRDEVSKRINLPVVVENDGNAAAWAECRFGAGRGARDVVMVTIGTGIGGGIVLNGALFRGEYGIAAEMGHMQVVPNGRRCGCGQRGCWEQYSSGRALVREAREIALYDPSRAAYLLSLGDGTSDGITGPHVTAAALAGDPVAVEAFEHVGSWAGIGLASLALMLDPALFIIGGGVSEAGSLLLDPSISAFRARLPGAAFRPIAEVRPAELGNTAGLVGAADLARLRES